MAFRRSLPLSPEAFKHPEVSWVDLRVPIRQMSPAKMIRMLLLMMTAMPRISLRTQGQQGLPNRILWLVIEELL